VRFDLPPGVRALGVFEAHPYDEVSMVLPPDAQTMRRTGG
jgi:hypothetical protein